MITLPPDHAIVVHNGRVVLTKVNHTTQMAEVVKDVSSDFFILLMDLIPVGQPMVIHDDFGNLTRISAECAGHIRNQLNS